jgi:hypothetical protein
MRELQTTDSEPEMDQEYSKEKDVAEVSNEEQLVSKKMKLMLGKLATQTRSATKLGGGRTSNFTLEDNPVDSIIRDLEGIRSRIAEYELQMQQVGELVGNPPRESLVAAIQEAIQDPLRLRELERKADHLTSENRKTTEQVRKLKAKREAFLKQVKDTTLTVQKVSAMVDIPGNVWWKAKMFNAELKNASHVSGSKIVTFIMDQRSKMDATLKAMQALIASCTELFLATIKSWEEGKTSSSYSDLTPHNMVETRDTAVGGENQHVEEVDQVEDITAITSLTAPPISATEVVVPIATPISSTVGEEIRDGCHVAEVTPPSPAMAFQMVVRDPPPLALLAPRFPSDSQLSAPLAADVAETVDHVGVIPESNGHEMSVPPPHAPSLTTDITNHREKRKQNKKEAKLKKRKDREYFLVRILFWVVLGKYLVGPELCGLSFSLFRFQPLNKVDCQDCHVVRNFQHGNHDTWVLVWFKREHFGVFLIILQCKCFLVQFRPYALLHLRFDLSLKSMCNANGHSFPYLRFRSFPPFPIIV